jgi:hypothetical protein
MKKILSLFIVFLVSCASGSNLGSSTVKHTFLVIDEGKCNLLYINENDSSRNWVKPFDGKSPRDMQLIGKNLLLVGHENGYSEIDIATGKSVKSITAFKNVTSARRLANGNTLVAGMGIDGKKDSFVLELDAKDNVIRKQLYKMDYLRLIRQTSAGTYMMACDMNIVEASDDGKIISEFPIDAFSHMWKAVKLPNGNILGSGGFGAYLVEIDSKGKVVRKIGGISTVPEKVNTHFYATFQLMPNGDIVVANWQGHGDGHGDSGVQLLEYDAAGKIVWSWSRAEMISSLQGILILDNLDTAVLHDEREGVMVPLTAQK